MLIIRIETDKDTTINDIKALLLTHLDWLEHSFKPVLLPKGEIQYVGGGKVIYQDQGDE